MHLVSGNQGHAIKVLQSPTVKDLTAFINCSILRAMVGTAAWMPATTSFNSLSLHSIGFLTISCCWMLFLFNFVYPTESNASACPRKGVGKVFPSFLSNAAECFWGQYASSLRLVMKPSVSCAHLVIAMRNTKWVYQYFLPMLWLWAIQNKRVKECQLRCS